jgi:hypothetical protein
MYGETEFFARTDSSTIQVTRSKYKGTSGIDQPARATRLRRCKNGSVNLRVSSQNRAECTTQHAAGHNSGKGDCVFRKEAKQQTPEPEEHTHIVEICWWSL